MGRSSQIGQAERTNTAFALLQKGTPLQEAAQSLGEQFGLSRRQAYRYLRKAQTLSAPLPIPDRRVPFTVKLPLRLVQELHRASKKRGESLSDLVTRALQVFLRKE